MLETLQRNGIYLNLQIEQQKNKTQKSLVRLNQQEKLCYKIESDYFLFQVNVSVQSSLSLVALVFQFQ